MSLLGAGDPAPVRVLHEDGASDFVIAVDHAGRAVPQALGMLGLPESEFDRHIACDIGIAGVSERMADALDAVTIMQAYSRLVIDCNRGHAVASSIPVVSERTRIPGNEALGEAERQARRDEIFAPYHRRIGDVLDARAGRRTVLIAMHSFTPVFMDERREMHAGVLYNRHTVLPRIMLDLFRVEGDLVVGDNAPYAVSDATDYTIPWHGEQRGIPHVEIEIRQDLIADARGQKEWAARMVRLLRLADARLKATWF